jgi:DNA-binding MarR family transcriptional regulator
VTQGATHKIPKDAAYETSVADRAARLNVALKRQLEVFSRRAFDISIVDTRMILMLGMFAPTTVNSLAARSDVDRTQISRCIRDLSERGWISRTQGADDRREAILALTPDGRKVHNKILAEAFQRNGALLEGIEPERLAIFFEVADLLIARARKPLEKPGKLAAE